MRALVARIVRIKSVARLLVLLGLVLAAASAPAAARNLLNNGDLSRGSGNSCDGWRSDAWILSPTTTEFTWIAPEAGNPGQLEVNSLHDNDARWTQTLSLTGGWYRLSVWARSEDTLTFFTGANISVLEDGIVSADLRGTQDWRELYLYLNIPPHGADVEIALRLGGYMNLTRGKAFFRDARVERIDAPPAGADHVFDLGSIRKSEAGAPIGQIWTLFATYIVLGLVAFSGWWLFAYVPRPAIATPVKAPPSTAVTGKIVPKSGRVTPKKRRKKKSQR
ncbi:MAG: hypothetical protein ABSG46_19515 [Candidatus Binataceae bacterium]